MFPNIQQYIENAITHFDKIPMERKELLSKISQYVASKIKAGEKAELIYICTHNSRRSHFGQIWAKTAAAYYGFENVQTYSGGTEATAFNPNAIKAAKGVGFEISDSGATTTPHYRVKYYADKEGILCFSKKFDDAANPTSGFCAVMTCGSADRNCPVVLGAAIRVATTYNDPKAFDGTPEQDAKYSERCLQIATETLYAFSRVKEFLS